MKERVYGGTNKLISALGLRNVYIDKSKHNIVKILMDMSNLEEVS